jgi:hypothetical protein
MVRVLEAPCTIQRTGGLNARRLARTQVQITQDAQGSAPSRYRFSVTCLKLGDVTLDIAVGNKATKTNKHPALAKATTTFSCQTPQTLFAHPVSRMGSVLRCSCCCL